jgi:hypothetical protein
VSSQLLSPGHAVVIGVVVAVIHGLLLSVRAAELVASAGCCVTRPL